MVAGIRCLCYLAHAVALGKRCQSCHATCSYAFRHVQRLSHFHTVIQFRRALLKANKRRCCVSYGHAFTVFAQVLEFTAFRERLAASHTRAVARAEAAIAAVRAAAGAGAGEGQGQAAADALRTTAIDAAKGLPVEELPTTGQGCANMGTLPAQPCNCMPTHAVVHAASVSLPGGGQMRLLCGGCIPYVTNVIPLGTAGSCRYNWDLAVRPTWLPPGTGGPAAEPLEWWRCRGQGAVRGHGYGR